MRGEVKFLTYTEACEFLLPRHYSGRKPVISTAFGWFIDGTLQAVCTFGKPASPSLCKGIMGEEYQSHVYELNRLCRVDELREPLSSFVSACLRRLRTESWIVVSYADTGVNHVGYIYQACNFLYTGITKARTDKFTEGNKHSRHYSALSVDKRKVRTAKHRYVYFATHDKRLKKLWREQLRYPVEPFPKTENQYYTLGSFLEPQVIATDISANSSVSRE